MSARMVETVIVRVEQGLLRGRKLQTKRNGWYYSFQGVPYAQPPLGARRFQPPQMVEPWTGVRDALSEGSVCPQLDMLSNEYVGDEDSLFLNVYTPQIKADPLKPVMVWIHGGGFNMGSGNADLYGPDYLVDAGVVLVTLNYRIGALGFLYIEGTDAVGNNGLKDQVAALRWVKRNVSQFGGNPGNITVFGESAGGASVHYQLLSPMSAGLFHRAIAQSGCAFNPWSYMQPSHERAYRLGTLLGCEESKPQDLVDFLRTVPAKDIVENQKWTLKREDIRVGIALPFVPTVESGGGGGGGGGGEVFLPHPPVEMIKRKMVHDVPLIAGVNSQEGLVLLKEIAHKLPAILENVNQNFEDTLPIDLATGNNVQTLAKKVKSFYFGDCDVGPETLSQYVDYLSDTAFVLGMYNTVKEHLPVVKSPIYFYRFGFEGSLGWLKKVVGVDGIKGPCHCDELGYLFTSTLFDLDCGPDTMEAMTIQRMVNMWTNFAKTGNPSFGPADPWKPVTSSNFVCMCIDDDLKLCTYPDLQKMKFWDGIYNDHKTSKL